MAKITVLEEHFAAPEVSAASQALAPELQDVIAHISAASSFRYLLCNLADKQMRTMHFRQDRDRRVGTLSLTTTGVQSLATGQALPLARVANDCLAEVRSPP